MGYSDKDKNRHNFIIYVCSGEAEKRMVEAWPQVVAGD